MWCPKCKNEYREGITVCYDCKAQLVPSLDDIKETEVIDDAEPVYDTEFANAINETQPKRGLFDSSTLSREQIMAIAEELQKRGQSGPQKAYVTARNRYEDNKSSAFALLLAGIIGGVAIGLHALGIIDFNLTQFSKYLINIVMGGLFVIFIVAGLVSLKNAKKYKALADEEDALTEKLIKGFEDMFPTPESLDKAAGINKSDSSYEMWQKRNIIIFGTVAQGNTLEDNYLEYIAEQVFNKYYEPEETDLDAEL